LGHNLDIAYQVEKIELLYASQWVTCVLDQREDDGLNCVTDTADLNEEETVGQELSICASYFLYGLVIL
jgi:hypothetical protein